MEKVTHGGRDCSKPHSTQKAQGAGIISGRLEFCIFANLLLAGRWGAVVKNFIVALHFSEGFGPFEDV